MNSRSGIFFLLFVFLLFILSAFLCYYRFLVKHDYVVSYNGECDPTTESCFISPDDNVSNKSIFYVKMQKSARDLHKECGKNIAECKEANTCLSSDRGCLKIYCDSSLANNDCSTQTLSKSVTSITKK